MLKRITLSLLAFTLSISAPFGRARDPQSRNSTPQKRIFSRSNTRNQSSNNPSSKSKAGFWRTRYNNTTIKSKKTLNKDPHQHH